MNDLKKAYNLAKQGDFKQALVICDGYIETYPKYREGYKQRSYIFAKMKLWDRAIQDADTLINLGIEEPDDYFSRGRWKLMLGGYESAIQDLTKVIEIESDFDEKYYSETAYFYRANAYLMISRYNEVINDCEHLRDGFEIYFMGQVVKKEELIMKAKKEISR